MATIIEIQEGKLEHLSEYAEKVVKYGEQLLDCIKSLEDKDHYSERYGRRGYRDHDYPREKEYSRYY